MGIELSHLTSEQIRTIGFSTERLIEMRKQYDYDKVMRVKLDILLLDKIGEEQLENLWKEINSNK